MLRKCYNWVLRQAEKRHAEWILFAVAVAEASFFPLPPDVLLLPMAVARRDRAWRLAAVCTMGSIVGGLIGYAIGVFAMATIGQWIIDTYHLQAAFDSFREGFNEWGVLIILGKGLTPIPFKLVTIASGIARLNLAQFILAAAATRAFRFFLISGLVRKYGEPIKTFVEKYLTWVALGILVAIVLGFWLVLR
ncbi:MAG: VTT domain-containing protein [Alphaproteobacteria bacterium]|nr:VTT domain-containing protein [Alphaproteobacteria bacterium]